MDTNTLILIAAGLLPAIALCIYVYIKDWNEKEPIRFLLLLFVLGMLCCFPALWLEIFSGSILDSIFAGSMIIEDGEIYMQTGAYYTAVAAAGNDYLLFQNDSTPFNMFL